MKIVINFDSCWLNGFLDEEDGLVINRKGISKPKVRKFFATSKSEKPTARNLSKDTVMGVLCRLIGDQRKLYKARYEDNYYFKGCEDSINFEIESELIPFDEKVMIINKSDNRPAQSTYLGVLPNDISLFSSEYSQNLWHVLDMNISELCDYILNETMVFEPKGMVSLNHILNRISDLTNLDINPPIKTIDRLLTEYDDRISKQNERLSLLDSSDEKHQKKTETLKAKIVQLLDEKSKILKNEAGNIFDRKIKDAAEKIQANFRKSKIIKDGVIYPITMYGAALYLNAIKLKSENIINFLGENNKLSGFAEDSFGFNGIRDFLNPLAGSRKKTIKTPADIKKHAGKLVIYVNPPINTEDLYEKIQNAGVSSFYLGKKGLAFVEDIRDWRRY